MIVGGSLSATALASPAVSSAISTRNEPPSPDVSVAASETRPFHFTMISSISHSSLASAYQVMKAHQAGVGPTLPETPGRLGEPAIISGLGVPAALNAYAEVLDTGDI